MTVQLYKTFCLRSSFFQLNDTSRCKQTLTVLYSSTSITSACILIVCLCHNILHKCAKCGVKKNSVPQQYSDNC